MKRLVLFVLLIVCTAPMIGQKLPSQMNECEFFAYLDVLKDSNYVNVQYQKVKDNFLLRANLLRRIEDYMLVFNNFVIGPMHLQARKDATDTLACPVFAEQFAAVRSKENVSVQEARVSVQKAHSYDIRFLLIDLTDLNKPVNYNVPTYIAELQRANTIERLYHHVDSACNDSTFDRSIHKLPQLVKEQNLRALAERMDVLDQNRFVWYEHYNSKPDFVKGFEMHHDNDVLLLPFRKINQDRELTGAFKFTLITDYVKWRWIRPTKRAASRVLTYQTISIIGGGYTPYIRYRNNRPLADSLYGFDRPFASYMCIERAKHRTWRSGLVKHHGEFQFGYIGISQGRKIQAQLHEDVITSSQFVYGWNDQIGTGGRLVIQLNHKAEFLLASTTNRYATVFRPHLFRVKEPRRSFPCLKALVCDKWCKHRDGCRKYTGLNVSAETEVRFGSMLWAMGGGIRLSTLDFLKQSGNNMIATRENSRDEFGWKFDMGFNYRWVIHNSLLQGLGFWQTFDEDPYDKVVRDSYVLRKDQIEHNMFFFDYGLSIRWRKTTVYFRHTWHTLEYKSDLDGLDFQDPAFTWNIDPRDVQYYNDTVIKEQNSFTNFKINDRIIYGYGTLGVSWLIE